MEEDQKTGFYLSLINRAARGYFAAALKPLGIGPGQQAYLLSLRPGERVIQEEIARRLKVDRANVSRAVQALEEKGLLTREKGGNDLRTRPVALTPRGVETRERVEAVAREWILRLKGDMTPEEWARGVDFLSRMAENLST